MRNNRLRSVLSHTRYIAKPDLDSDGSIASPIAIPVYRPTLALAKHSINSVTHRNVQFTDIHNMHMTKLALHITETGNETQWSIHYNSLLLS